MGPPAHLIPAPVAADKSGRSGVGSGDRPEACHYPPGLSHRTAQDPAAFLQPADEGSGPRATIVTGTRHGPGR